MTTLQDIIGSSDQEEFLSFNMTEIQEILFALKDTQAIDLPHALLLQQQALRAADIILEYLGKVVKTVGFLESKVSVLKNKTSLDYQAPNNARTTVEMKKWAGEASPEVEELLIKLARAKASKVVLEKKYDILIKEHHHYKEIAMGYKRTILGSLPNDSVPMDNPNSWT